MLPGSFALIFVSVDEFFLLFSTSEMNEENLKQPRKKTSPIVSSEPNKVCFFNGGAPFLIAANNIVIVQLKQVLELQTDVNGDFSKGSHLR